MNERQARLRVLPALGLAHQHVSARLHGASVAPEAYQSIAAVLGWGAVDATPCPCEQTGMDTQATPPAPRSATDVATWTAFLAVAFLVVGLVGAFATFAAQIPFDRAMARSQALDEAVADSHAANPQAAFERLRPLLGDSADRVLAGQGTIEERVNAERPRMLAALHAESLDYGLRLRVVIAAFTAAAALFGAMVLSIVSRK